jgi:hypothetical protein
MAMIDSFEVGLFDDHLDDLVGELVGVIIDEVVEEKDLLNR